MLWLCCEKLAYFPPHWPETASSESEAGGEGREGGRGRGRGGVEKGTSKVVIKILM